jgi:hypothetical protein
MAAQTNKSILITPGSYSGLSTSVSQIDLKWYESGVGTFVFTPNVDDLRSTIYNWEQNSEPVILLGGIGTLNNQRKFVGPYQDYAGSFTGISSFPAIQFFPLSGKIVSNTITVSGIASFSQIFSVGLSTFSSLNLSGPFYDRNFSPGTAGQILSSTTNGVEWIPASSASIGGSISSNQVAFGSSSNTIQGISTFVFRNGSLGIGLTNPRGSLETSEEIYVDKIYIGAGNSFTNTIIGFGATSFGVAFVERATIIGRNVNQGTTNDTIMPGVYIGDSANTNNTFGLENPGPTIVIGNNALSDNDNGSTNSGMLIIGNNAYRYVENADIFSTSTVIGHEAYSGTPANPMQDGGGGNSVVIGYGAVFAVSHGNSVVIGNVAGLGTFTLSSNSNNTIVGAYAGPYMSNSNNNTFIGHSANPNYTAASPFTGGNNIAIGHGVGVTNGDYQIAIGIDYGTRTARYNAGAWGGITNNTRTDLGIGTLNPLARLHVATLNAANAGFYLAGQPSQTANLFRIDQIINGNPYFVINGIGSVGIYTSVPTQAFDVLGNVRFRGNIFDSSNTSGTANQILVSTSSGILWTSANTIGIVTGINGVANYLAKFGSPNSLTTSNIIDNGSVITIGLGMSVNGFSSSLGFYGPGTNLTNLNASNLASGTVPSARVVGNYSGITSVGNLTNLNVIGIASATGYTGDGANLTNLNASALSSGTVPSVVVSGTYSGITSVGNLTQLNVIGVVTSLGYFGPGTSLTNLNASNLASGTVPSAVVSGTYSGITSVGNLTNLNVIGIASATGYTGDGANLTNLNASNLATGTVPTARVVGTYSGITSVGTLTQLRVTGISTLAGASISSFLLDLAGRPGLANSVLTSIGTAVLWSASAGGGGGGTIGGSISATQIAFGASPNNIQGIGTLVLINGLLGVNTNAPVANLDVFGVVNVTGVVTSMGYTGPGTNLTNLNASNLASGTVPSATVSGFYSGITSVGTLTQLRVTGFSTVSNLAVSGSIYDSVNNVGLARSVLISTGTGISWSSVPAAGRNTWVQFNSGGTLGASTNLTFDAATSRLALGGGIEVGQDSFLSNRARMYYDSSLGLVFSGRAGSGNDLTFTSGSGNIVFSNPTGTSDFQLTNGSLLAAGFGSFGGYVRIDGGSFAAGQNRLYQDGSLGFVAVGGRSGTANDFTLLARDGFTIFRNPTGTRNLEFTNGTITVPAGNFGIGTTIPNSKLHVETLSASARGFYLAGQPSQTANLLRFDQTTNGLPYLVVTGIGSIGVYTSIPTQAFDVSGNVRLRGGVWDSSNNQGLANSVLTSTGSGGVLWAAPGSGTPGGGTIGGSISATQIAFGASPNNIQGVGTFVLINGLLGVNTNNPVANLDVFGVVNVTGVVTSLGYTGPGTNLTNLNASNLASGTVPSDRVSGNYSGITSVGTLTQLRVTGISTLAGASISSFLLDLAGRPGLANSVLTSIGTAVLWSASAGGAGGGTIGGSISATQIAFGASPNNIQGIGTFVFNNGSLGIGTDSPRGSLETTNEIYVDNIYIGAGNSFTNTIIGFGASTGGGDSDYSVVIGFGINSNNPPTKGVLIGSNASSNQTNQQFEDISTHVIIGNNAHSELLNFRPSYAKVVIGADAYYNVNNILDIDSGNSVVIGANAFSGTKDNPITDNVGMVVIGDSASKYASHLQSVVIGANAGMGTYTLAASQQNTLIGFQAGGYHDGALGAEGNTFIGANANSTYNASNPFLGGNNIAIGRGVGVTDGDYQIAIGVSIKTARANAGAWGDITNSTRTDLGIGTLNPLARLHVETLNAGNAGFYLAGQPSQTANLLEIDRITNGSPYFVITGIGSVGIYTSIPTQAFDVSGNVRFRGNIFDSSNTSGLANQVLVSTSSGILWTSANTIGIVTGINGLTNYIARFGSPNSLTTSNIIDNGSVITIGLGMSVNGFSSSLGFYGPGTNLTNLNASSLASGTVPSARVAGNYSGITSVGNLTQLNVIGVVTSLGYFGPGTSLTNLNASNLASGTVPSAVVSGTYSGITSVGTLTQLRVTGISTLAGASISSFLLDLAGRPGLANSVLTSIGTAVLWSASAGGGPGGGTIGGSISVNQIPFGASANTIQGVSTFVLNNGLLGVNTNDPLSNLDVFGTFNVSGFSTVRNINISGRLYDNSVGSGNTGQLLTSTNSGIAWTTIDAIYYNLGADQVAYGIGTTTITGASTFVYRNGNLGVGTVAPTAGLHVQAGARFNGEIFDRNNSSGGPIGIISQVLTSTGAGVTWAPIKRSLVIPLMTAFTPTQVGIDSAVFIVPQDPINGIGIVTFNFRRVNLRVETPYAGITTINIAKSTGSGRFVGTSILQSNLNIIGAATYESNSTSFAVGYTTCSSGDKLSVNFIGVNTFHQNFTVELIAQEA